MNVFIQILSMFAMVCSVFGSKLVAELKPAAGSMSFIVANVTNLAVGLAVGNLALALLQLAFMLFTIPMYRSLRFSVSVTIYGVATFAILGISSNQHFTMPLIDTIGTLFAIAGSYAMLKREYRIMAVMWIVADSIFVGVAMREGLAGLLIQSLAFVYYGFRRLQPTAALAAH